MFKHNAISIKETSDKMFVSSKEKTGWNNKAEPIHDHNETHYSKSEMEDMLDTSFINVIGSQVHVDIPYGGYTKDFEIHGNTEQFTETIINTPTMEAGGISSTTGSNADITQDGVVLERYRCQGYIEVKMGDEISFLNNSSANIRLYDSNKKFITATVFIPTYIIDNPDIKFMRFYGDSTIKTTKVYIRRTHLSDYRSVGTERPDGSYEFNIIKCGVNVFNVGIKHGNLMLHNTDKARFSSDKRIKVKPNTYYTIHAEGYQIMACKVNEDNVEMGAIGDNLYKAVYTFNSGNNKFIGIQGRNEHGTDITLDNVKVQLEFGETKSPFEPYKPTMKKIILPVQLEGIGATSDRLFVRNDGVVCIEKWIKYRSYIDPEVEKITVCDSSFDAPTEKTYLIFIDAGCMEYSRPILCDKLPEFFNWSVDRESIYKPINKDGSLHTTFHIRIAKQRLVTNPTKNDFKNFVNTLNFKYISKTPKIIEVGNIKDLQLELEKGVNNIFTDSETINNIKCSIPVSVSNTIESQTNKIQQLKDNVNQVSKIIQPASNMSVEYNNGFMSVTDTPNGYVSDTKIEGGTYVSVVSNRMFLREATDFFDIHSKYVFSSDGYITATKTKEDTGYLNLYPRRKLYNVKSNTKYTLIVEVVENTMTRTDENNIDRYSVIYFANTADADNGNHKTIFKNGYRFGILSKKVGLFKFLVETRDLDTVLPDDIGDRIFIVNVSEGSIKFRYALVEGDHTKNDSINGAFTGVTNVCENKELSLISNGENLFNYKPYNRGNATYRITDNSIHITCKNPSRYVFKYFYMDLKPNTKYTLSMNKPVVVSGHNELVVRVVNNGEVLTGNNLLTLKSATSGSFTTPEFIGKGDFKIAIALYSVLESVEGIIGDVTYSNIKVVEGETITGVRNTEHELVQQIKEPLRSLPNGVKDTIEKHSDGKYYVFRRCGSVTFDSSNTNQWSVNANSHNNEVTMLFTVNRANSGIWDGRLFKGHCTLYANEQILPSAWDSVKVTQGVIFGSNFDFRMLRSNLVTEDIAGFRSYISKNPLTIVYELEYPIMEPLNVDINLRTFENTTHFVVNSGNSILPTISYKLPCNLSSSIKVIQDKLHSLETKQMSTIQMLVRSTFEADKTAYRFEILADNVRSSDSDIDLDLFTIYKKIIESGDYDRFDIENKIDFYTIISKFTYEMADDLFMIIENQYNDIATE